MFSYVIKLRTVDPERRPVVHVCDEIAMAFSPHSAGGSSFRDPYQLDRLADELANRESSAYNTDSRLSNDSDNQPVPEFQEPVPLSHGDPHLSAEEFNAEEFLLERRKIALPDLRAELRQYLAALKEELVKLINDDYEAFISLSTDLRDEGARLERLRYPLGTLKTNVLVRSTFWIHISRLTSPSVDRSLRESWK